MPNKTNIFFKWKLFIKPYFNFLIEACLDVTANHLINYLFIVLFLIADEFLYRESGALPFPISWYYEIWHFRLNIIREEFKYYIYDPVRIFTIGGSLVWYFAYLFFASKLPYNFYLLFIYCYKTKVSVVLFRKLHVWSMRTRGLPSISNYPP